ncbi:hypothetical protein MKW98_028073 [Papaver atlanticum]|uniref:RNA helicase n=1 Tax=Papaver atlanticum TaxID=357466 RepID=A0AAD4SVK0_9MAGN|nr:hypothetical protein MKW98_028073 [Papaver atlanticum]
MAASNIPKPLFLTKAQRQQQQAEEHVVSAQKRLDNHQKYHHSDKERDSERRKRERELEDEKRRCRKRIREEEQAEKEKEKDLEAIREQYLGTAKKPKMRVIKPSQKFRFTFDWDATEDTSRDLNSLYQNPHEAKLLFGRGFRAGMDRREQKKKVAAEDAPAVKKQKEQAVADRLYDTSHMKIHQHWSDKKLEDMTERDWRIFREDFNISYKGSKVPNPMRNWRESKLLSTELLKAVERVGYKTPTPIQKAVIPLGLQQRDVIGIAQTGSGKTAAFVLPMLAYISRLPPMTDANAEQGPYAVVLAPTRELAQQIENETVKFAHYLGIRVVSIVGKKSILEQAEEVMKILDAMPSSNLKPDNEDEELDAKRTYRTTYMFSATMSSAVERLAKKYLRNPVVVTIGTAGEANELITQNVTMMQESEKFPKLQKLLNELGEKTAIVFTNAKKSADSVFKNLDKNGYRVAVLHGDMSQDQREKSLAGFKNKRFNVLVATNVAARGLDIPDVAHVINFDMPEKIDMYTHRIGRTGRAGNTGVATTFLTLQDSDVFEELRQALIQSNSLVPPELARHKAASKFKPGSYSDRSASRNDKGYR